jgi:hypothetical protein
VKATLLAVIPSVLDIVATVALNQKGNIERPATERPRASALLTVPYSCHTAPAWQHHVYAGIEYEALPIAANCLCYQHIEGEVLLTKR